MYDCSLLNCFLNSSIAASRLVSCSRILASRYTAGRWLGSVASAFSTRGFALAVDSCKGSFINTVAYNVSDLGELLSDLQA